VSVIGGVAGSSKQGRKAAWKFVKDNWEELYNRYQGGFLISRLIKARSCCLIFFFIRSCDNVSDILRRFASCLTQSLYFVPAAHR